MKKQTTNYDLAKVKNMRKDNLNKARPDRKLMSEKRNYFQGDVGLHDLSETVGMRDQKAYYVKVINGARTKLHYHEGTQPLVVTEGLGMLVIYKKILSCSQKVRLTQEDRTVLRRGDVVYIPKNTPHWHGASSGKSLAHIALNGFSHGTEARTVWVESDFKSYATRIS